MTSDDLWTVPSAVVTRKAKPQAVSGGHPLFHIGGQEAIQEGMMGGPGDSCWARRLVNGASVYNRYRWRHGVSVGPTQELS